MRRAKLKPSELRTKEKQPSAGTQTPESRSTMPSSGLTLERHLLCENSRSEKAQTSCRKSADCQSRHILPVLSCFGCTEMLMLSRKLTTKVGFLLVQLTLGLFTNSMEVRRVVSMSQIPPMLLGQ